MVHRLGTVVLHGRTAKGFYHLRVAVSPSSLWISGHIVNRTEQRTWSQAELIYSLLALSVRSSVPGQAIKHSDTKGKAGLHRGLASANLTHALQGLRSSGARAPPASVRRLFYPAHEVTNGKPHSHQSTCSFMKHIASRWELAGEHFTFHSTSLYLSSSVCTGEPAGNTSCLEAAANEAPERMQHKA